MGLDMNLNRTSRDSFESKSREDFWKISLDVSEEIMYWRKAFNLDNWFHENTKIIEECSNELSKEKLLELVKWLFLNNFNDDANNLKEIIDKNDFKKYVIYYSYCS